MVKEYLFSKVNKELSYNTMNKIDNVMIWKIQYQ